jgi:hypothetical protein
MMTCNAKAISKVMGWGMTIKMIREVCNIGYKGRDSIRRDRLRTPGIVCDAIEWRA